MVFYILADKTNLTFSKQLGRMYLHHSSDTLNSFLKTGSYLTQVYVAVYLTDLTSYYLDQIIFIQLAFGNFLSLKTICSSHFQKFDQI